eukprot:CAMPEP_0194051146 /NCGR_PEP_ID=MMETSP0009_2-20130614/38871_1 /TAXON_ID=210454 /ORGANISM="Grammatophora oceanica, Strain CCMP 410" /LENGTH=100 /DNA_ID=CAMNT_0038698099 /DNA_START=1 /DNA_END=300 /DNA_ORIENTATION=+
MMCATYVNGATCHGDSGGPVVIEGEDYTEDVVVGLVSFGDAGCDRGHYNGIARVVSQIDWINSNVCFHSTTTNEAPPDDFGCDSLPYLTLVVKGIEEADS